MLDAAVDDARNVADALLRQATRALLLLASMLVGEVIALIPLLTDDPGATSAKPVIAASSQALPASPMSRSRARVSFPASA